MILVAAGWAPGTKSENETRKPIQSTPAQAAIRANGSDLPSNRRMPRIRRHPEDQPPGRRPRNLANPRTKPEITPRNRNQSTTAPAATRRPTKATPSTRGIPTIHSHHHNQSPPARPRDTQPHGPNRQTKPENQTSPHPHRPSSAPPKLNGTHPKSAVNKTNRQNHPQLSNHKGN